MAEFGLACTEELVGALRDPAVYSSGLIRNIYVTTKSLGSEGSTGRIRQGDLASDEHAKIITFDFADKVYKVSRNGNPPPPEETVPDGDVGALLRSFVRDASAVRPTYITLTDVLLAKGVETVRKSMDARQVELYCQHGPVEGARGVPYVKWEESTEEDASSYLAWIVAAVLIIGGGGVYYMYWRARRPPPDSLTHRPVLLEGRSLQLNPREQREVISRLVRGE